MAEKDRAKLLGNSLSTEWKAWVDVFEGYKSRLTSHKQVSLRWLTAIPIGFRNPLNPSDFTLGAAGFLGFDAALTLPELDEMLRYVYLHIYQINVVSLRETTGQVEGLEESMRAFSHQIKSVAFGAGVGWSVTPDRWKRLISMFEEQSEYRDKLAAYRILPVPEIFEALASTLRLWSLSFRPDDLFPDAKLPTTLERVAQIAWRFAEDNRFVQSSINRDFSAMKQDVIDAWKHRGLELRELDAVALRVWAIDGTKFDEGPQLENRLKQLGGLLRVLVIASENFLQHALDIPTMTIDAGLIGDRMFLDCSNKRGKDTPSASTMRHLGFRGLQLIDFLLKSFLRDLDPVCHKSSPGDSPARFSLRIEFDQPDWLTACK
jgi:hypothetical protein